MLKILPLVQAGRKAIVSQINTLITLKEMGYSRRRAHQVPFPSAKNRKLRLHTGSPSRTIGDWKKLACGLISLFFFWMVGSEFDLNNMKTWIHPALNQRFMLVVVQGIISWHTLGTNWALLKHHSLPIVANLTLPLKTTVHQSCDGYFQQEYVPCHKSQIISNCCFEHDNEINIYKNVFQISVQ